MHTIIEVSTPGHPMQPLGPGIAALHIRTKKNILQIHIIVIVGPIKENNVTAENINSFYQSEIRRKKYQLSD